jgi:hypothetical protein
LSQSLKAASSILSVPVEGYLPFAPFAPLALFDFAPPPPAAFVLDEDAPLFVELPPVRLPVPPFFSAMITFSFWLVMGRFGRAFCKRGHFD